MSNPDKAQEITENNRFNDDVSEWVDIIASGYEWVCPACSNLNKEIECKETVVCQKCCRDFQTYAPEHAMG